ncbi:MAG: ABC transporter permease [Lachnospiraceae bacterium]|nr:ABC transporter permease [Lachnospiraceae bacterium]
MLLENCKLALSSIKANKMRSFLTMLGIIIGVAAVIAIMTVGNSMTKSVVQQLQSYGAKNIYVGISPMDWNAELSEADDEAMKFQPETIHKLVEKFPDQIEAVSVDSGAGSGEVRIDNSTAKVNINGVSAGYFVSNQIKLESGNYFTDYAYEKGTNTAIVSTKFAEKIFGAAYDASDVCGKEVEVNINDEYTTFTVVGIYKQKENEMSFGGYSGDQSTNMYIPLKTAWNMNHDDTIYSMEVVVKEGVDAVSFATEMQDYLTTLKASSLGEKFMVDCYSNQSMITESTNSMKSMTMAISLIAAIALIVGGIGVMNIMTVSITERTREIGTRKALGAQDSMIMLQFISEAIIICLIGGIIGIVVGLVIGHFGANAMGYEAQISISSIYISVLFSMAIGVFFGYSPAKHAAKMNPIDALRYE